MRILICGLGSIGRRHKRNLLKLGQDELVLYRTGKSTLADDELGRFPTEHNLEEALARWQPEAAFVTNPTSLHIPTALQAAAAGAHIFLEKPVSHSMEGVSNLLAAVEADGLKVQVGYQFRFHPGLARVKSLLEQGEIGQPLTALVHWGEYLPGWHPWEDYRQSYSAKPELGGGVVLTLSHPFDYFRWLFGEVTSVTAETAQPGALDVEVESLANVSLTHAGGTTSAVHLNYLQRPPRHDLEIVCSQGTIRWDALQGAVTWWKVDDQNWQQQAPPAQYERNRLFLDEVEHFLQIINSDVQPRCGLADGIAALQISLAALESGLQGERVRIPEKARA